MDDEQKRFDAAMKAIDDGKACDDYKTFARGIVRGIFGREEKPVDEWEDITGSVTVRLEEGAPGYRFVHIYDGSTKAFVLTDSTLHGKQGCIAFGGNNYRFDVRFDTYRFFRRRK